MNKIITDLSSGRNYEVRVRSRSGDSYSEWSPVLQISSEETKKAALPNPVSSVTVLDPEGNNTGTTFVGQWGVPTTLDLDFSRYQYQWGYSPYLEANFFPVKPLETTAETASLTIEQNRAIFGSSPKATLKLRVRTVDTSGNVSAWVTSSAAVNDAPAAPTSLNATPAIDTISFFWTAPADNDIDYYELHSGTAGFTPGSGTLIAISSNTNFAYTTTTYTTRVFAVRAVDKFGTPGAKSGEVSSAASQSNNSDITAPPTPTGLSLSAGTPSQSLASINVSWNSVYASANDVSIYKVRYSTSTSGPWTYIPVDARTSASADITSAVISSLAPSSTYYVQIAAADKSGNISAYTASSSITTAKNTTAPSTPTPPTAAANGMQIQVSHDNTKAAGGPIESDVIGYEVYAGTSIGTYTKIGFLPRSTTTSALFSVTSTGGESTQLWYVNVKAVNSSNISSASASTDAQASPTLIAAANIVNATIGDAQIGNLNVDKLRSGTISANDIKIGTNGIKIDGVSKTIESSGFSTGSTGWQINSDDSAEFNNLTVRNTFKIEDGITPVNISAYSRTAGDSKTIFTANGHGYSTGDYVLISGTTVVDTGLTPMVITWMSNNTFFGYPNSATTAQSGITGSAVKVDNTVRLTNDGLTIGNSGSGVVSIGPTSFQIRSSSTGTRTAIDNTGISVYKSDDPVVSLKSDGTFFLKSAVTGNRVELDGDNGLRVKDSDNNTIIKVDTDGLSGNSKPIPIDSIGPISATISSLSATPLASQSATITSAKTLESGNFLYTADNSFNVGQTISISGYDVLLDESIYNNSPAFITSADSSSFQIAHDLLKSSITSITASATGGDPSNEGLVTFTANNSLNVGDLVSISGTASSTLNPSGYNYKNAIVYTGTTGSQVVLSVPGVDTETISSAGTITKIYADAGAGSASSLSSVYSKVATTEDAHGFSVGLPVDISGTGSYETNPVIILSIPSGTKFSYYSTNSGTTTTSLIASLNGYKKIATSVDHGLKPGQRFSVSGSSGYDSTQLVVEDIKDTKTFIYPTNLTGTSTGGFLARETFSVDIDDGTAAFSGDLVSSSYKIYSLTNSGLTLTEEDGLKLTRESTQNYILNPSFSTTGSNPVPSSSQNWILTGSYASAVANSTASDTGMGNLAGPNSLKTSAIIATAFTDTLGSSLKSVTTNYSHGFGMNDQISINYVPSGTVTPQSINARETLSGAYGTVFTYTPASAVNISSITGASTTKTVTTSTPHSFVTNQKVWIAGTDNTLLNNVSAVITNTGANTFTYTGASAATAQPNNSSNITSASASGTTYTYTANNTYSIGEKVTITGLNSNYNVTGDITARSGTNFVLTGTAVSPSTWNNTATVTDVLGSGSSIVYTATNAFAPGTLVTTTGLPSQYNLASAAITSSDGSSFTVSGSATGTWTKTISGISDAVSDGAGNTTYTLPAGHNITVGSVVTLSGMLGFPGSAFPRQVSALVGTTGFILADGATGTWSSGATIIDAENTGSSITYTTSTAHSYESGSYVTISNMNTAYNVSNVLITSASGSTFTVSTAVTPSVWGNYKIIESASAVDTTIAYTTPTPHNLTTGQKIVVSGINSTYNTSPSAFTITTTGTNSFTIPKTVTGSNWSRTVFPYTWSPNTPTAKTITAISALSSGYRTATCSAHGYPVGAVVTIAVTNPATLSEIVTITSVATNTFTYLSKGTGTFVSGGTASVTTHAVTAPNTFSVGQNVTISNLPFSTTTRTVSTISALTGTYRTATTSAAHGFVPGNMISITGVTGNTNLNEIITIATVPSTTTFTYVSAAAGAGASAQTGTATAINSEVQANAITVASGSSFSTTSNNSYTTRSTTYSPTNTTFSTTTASSTFPSSIVLNLSSVSTFPSSGSVWDTTNPTNPREISYTGKASGPITISSITAGAANVARSANVLSGHGLVIGSRVTISGVPSPNTALNTTVTVTGTTLNSFSFSISTATTATGTISASAAFNILSGCTTASASLVSSGANIAVYPAITFPIVSPVTIRSAGLISYYPPSGYLKITDSASATHIVSYTSRDTDNFLGCKSVASDITDGTLKFGGGIAQQPYAVITGRRMTVTVAQYTASTKLITYTTSIFDPAPVVGALVSVSGFTTDTTFNISNATIKSVIGNNQFTVYYPINSKSADASDTTTFGVAITETAIGKQYSAALATGSGLINSGSASVPVGVAATSLVGTASPSASGSTLTSSRISSVGSLNRPTAKTTVSLVDAADKAVTGSFWVYQNSESLGAYLNLKDFSITDGINTVQYSSNNFYSDTIPYGKWTQISKVFDLTSEWLDGNSTFKIPTGVYATRSVVISSISAVGDNGQTGRRTLTTSSNHGFTNGDKVTISGFTTGSTFNETDVIIYTTGIDGVTLLASNTFTYVSNATGTIPATSSSTTVTGISRTDSTVYYSGVMLTMTDGLTEYFDGDHQGVWSVGRGSSISTKDSFTSGQIRLRAGSNLAVGEGNYFSELDKISFSSSLPQKVSPYVAPVSLDLYDSVLGHLPPQRGIAIYSGTDTDSKSAYLGITTDGTTGILTLGGISKIQGNPYFTDVRTVYKQGSSTVYNTSGTYAFLNYSSSPVIYFGNIPFTVPASGQCIIDYGSNYYLVSSANAGASIYLALSISTGVSATGTVLWDERNSTGAGAASSRVLVAQIDTGSSSSIDTALRSSFSRRHVFYGTPGQTYYAQLSSKGSGGTYQINIPQIIITPVLAKI